MTDDIEYGKITEEQYQIATNAYQQYANTFVEGFVSNMFSNGMIQEADAETIREYFANPDNNQQEIAKLAQYYYISSVEVREMYDKVESLPTLNFKVGQFEVPARNDENISLINKTMKRLRHKRLTRDILKQVSATGTLVGMWIGKKNNLYPYIFEDNNTVFPAYRGVNGEWVCKLDLAFFEAMEEDVREFQFENFSPYITKQMYNAYLKDKQKNQYVVLPQDRTFVLQTGTLMRNQKAGTSWITSGLFDILHKRKLKDVEQSLANKVINAVAVLTIGHIGTNEVNKDLTNMKLPSAVKRKVHSGVKNAFEKNNTKGINVVTIPDFAKIEFPNVNYESPSNKFDSVNEDIRFAYGLGSSKATNDNMRLNLELFYMKLAVLLESVEDEMYQKMINLMFPKKLQDNYYITYDKDMPLTNTERLNATIKLSDKGFSVKAVIDQLNGIEWDDYVQQTLYETEDLKLQSRMIPYLQSSTLSSADFAILTGREHVGAGSGLDDVEVTEDVSEDITIE